MSATPEYAHAVSTAFALAQQLAQSAAIAIATFADGDDLRDAHIDAVTKAIADARQDQSDAASRREIEQFITGHARCPRRRAELLDLLDAVEFARTDPAYLYGLAMGLALAGRPTVTLEERPR